MLLEGIFAELFERDIPKLFSGKSSSQLSTAKKEKSICEKRSAKNASKRKLPQAKSKTEALRGVLSGSLVCPPGVLLGCPWGMTFACFPVCFRLCFPVYALEQFLKRFAKYLSKYRAHSCHPCQGAPRVAEKETAFFR